MRKLFQANGAALALIFAIPIFTAPANAQVTVGTSEIGNCYPFSCGYFGTYQQVYSSSAFSGPLTVNSVDFFTTVYEGTLNTGRYTFAFYYTDLPVDGLSGTPANNRGVLLSNFGTFNIAGLAPTTLTFSGNSYLYDPSQGNLLLDVFVDNVTEFGSSAQDIDDDSGDLSSRYFRDNYSGGADSLALVTRFNNNAVPEPATWAMMLVGFGGIGYSMRRRRKAGSTAQLA